MYSRQRDIQTRKSPAVPMAVRGMMSWSKDSRMIGGLFAEHLPKHILQCSNHFQSSIVSSSNTSANIFLATTGATYHTKKLTSKTYAAGNFYNLGLRMIIDPGTPLANINSSDYKGYYIAPHGMAYSTKDYAETHGTSAVARITYVGNVSGYFSKFLAIALENATVPSGSATIYLRPWSTMMSIANTWASSHAITVGGTTYNSCPTTAYDQMNGGTNISKPKDSDAGTGWRVPSVTDWKYIFDGIGGKTYDETGVSIKSGVYYSTGINDGGAEGSMRALLNVWCGQAYNATTPITVAVQDCYWTSSEYKSDTGKAWCYDFMYSRFNNSNKESSNLCVRAVFAY